MRKQPPRRRAYLITVWCEARPDGQPPICRFCLEDPQTGQRRVFANAITLVAALQTGFIGNGDEDGEAYPA